MKREEKRDIYQAVTDEIIAALERGVAPWVRPWRQVRTFQGGNAIFPVNVRGSSYRGVNVLNLWAVAQREGYTSNIWLTFNQARQAGGGVKKGEKVRIHVTNVETTPDATHGFAIPAYNVQASLDPGEVVSVEFVATKTGDFAFYCTEFCSALHLEMQGWMLVEP